jgi:hypothetical protein
MAIDFHPISDIRLDAQRIDRPDIDFVVAAMFTASVRDRADRLKASLESTILNYVLYQVPSVHRSISANGSDDIALCKPNFIHRILEEMRRSVLYLDADTVIYNWYADPATDRYKPLRAEYDGVETNNRFYKFSLAVDMFDPNQLVCSGAVQYYANTAGARNLLRSWLAAIHRYPDVADDESLDATFNFPTTAPVTTAWLEKEYCRYPWWIHIRPVIDHPDGPAAVDHSRSARSSFWSARSSFPWVRSIPSSGSETTDCSRSGV